MPPFEFKSALASKGVWGGIVAVIAGVLGLLGYTLTPADQLDLVGLLSAIVSAVGGIVAIWGRIVATKRIG